MVNMKGVCLMVAYKLTVIVKVKVDHANILE